MSKKHWISAWPYHAKGDRVYFEKESTPLSINFPTSEAAKAAAKYMSDAYTKGWQHAKDLADNRV
jgi:hypothetical protein